VARGAGFRGRGPHHGRRASCRHSRRLSVGGCVLRGRYAASGRHRRWRTVVVSTTLAAVITVVVVAVVIVTIIIVALVVVVVVTVIIITVDIESDALSTCRQARCNRHV